MRAVKAILAVMMLVALAGCAPRQLEVKELPEEPGPALPPIEIREVALGVGDEVDVIVWRQPELTRRVKITRTGELPYPTPSPADRSSSSC